MSIDVRDVPLRSPKGNPILGHWPDMARDTLGYLTRLAREFGDFVPLRFVVFPTVFVNHPSMVEEVLVTRHRSFGKSRSNRQLRALLGTGLLTSEGEFWLRQRRLAQPAFHRERIEAYGTTMTDYAERMVATWRTGEEREVHEDMMRLTMEIVGKTLFDADLGADADEVGIALSEALVAFDSRIRSLWALLPERFPTPGVLRLRRAVRQLDRIVHDIIGNRRRSDEDRGDLLSMLLHARVEEDGGGMTDQQLRDEVLTLFLAGHETTALVLSWAWYLLSTHPGAEARLHAELRAVRGGRTPTVADVPRLRFTNMVVTETMRLFPPAWAMGRRAVEDTVVGGRRIPKGTTIMMSQWTMHRDARYFDEPDSFRPERWESGLESRLPRFAYFPFGGGPRKCIGSNFAMLEAILVLATIAQRFRFDLLPGQVIVPEPLITLRPKHGIRMRLQERYSAGG
jgi:cytochrome P450